MSGKRRRRCSFDNCPSTDTLNAGLTFYSFPKCPVRRQKWMEISGCTSPASCSYLCELHFDDIYISKTPRRNQLLNSAVPRAMRDNDNSYKISIPRKVQTIEDAVVEEDCFADYIWNSAGELVKRGRATEVQDESDYNNVEEGIVEEINDKETMQLDQTIEDEISEPIVLSTNENSVSEDDDDEVQETETTEQPELEIETQFANEEVPLLKPSEISTFIFNGEEFVQMPKRVYLAERHHLESQLRVYKNLISNLKNQLSGVTIDEL